MGMIIIKLKTARGFMSLVELSRLTGISRQHLSDIERGKKDPSLNAIDAICKALGCKTEDLIEYKED